jgi:hypothetical protein
MEAKNQQMRIAQLEEVERKWGNLKKTMPATDLQIHDSLSPEITWNNEEDGLEEDELEAVKDVWEYVQNGKTFKL